jgi:zinc protease
MAANYTLKHNGVFWIAGEVARGKSLNRTTNKLIRETKSLCGKAISERSLQKTKNQYMLGYVSEIETNDGIAQFLGLREAYFKDYRFYKKEIEIYNSITVEEVKSSCESLFKDGKHILVSIWNKHPDKK